MMDTTSRIALLAFLTGILAGVSAAQDPRADQPGFDDLKLWPEPDGKPAYKTQAWDKTRLLVWAKPGVDGKFDSAASWLEDGKVATKAPDKDTDLLLPASEKHYMVQAGGSSACRHLTVEKGGLVIGGHPGAFEACGNVWAKAGGMVHFIDLVGYRHTFFRNDNAFPKLKDTSLYTMSANNTVHNGPKWNQTHIHHKMVIAKEADASVELVGQAGIGDELYVAKGIFIVGPGSEFRYRAMAKGSCEVFDGGTIQIQSGANLSVYNNGAYEAMNLSIYKGGELRAGSPDRLIRGDAFVLLAFKAEELSDSKLGIYTANGAKMRVYSADPTKHRMVFTSITSRADFVSSRGDQLGNPGTKAAKDLGTVLRLAGDVQLDGVMFDYVRAGGLRLADPKMRQTWKNVTFGEHNAGGEDVLIGAMDMKTDIYYHKRHYMRMERVTGALNGMKQFSGHTTSAPASQPTRK
jgi:hypothetical protein